MANELMPQCGVCGSRGTHKVGAETAAPAVGCHCGVIVTGFTEAEATERWERLARRAEVGALVERIVDSELDLAINSSHGPRTFYASTPESFTGLSVDGWPSLLEALRALAAEIGGER